MKWTFKVLMAQFKEMPTILKFITAHALACTFLLIGALLPGIPFYYNGEELSFKEIWSSGIGFFIIYVAIAMPYSGLLILKRADNFRLIYLSILSSVLIGPYVYWQDLQGLMFGLVVTSLITVYIFAYPPAKNYFTSNKSINTDPKPHA